MAKKRKYQDGGDWPILKTSSSDSPYVNPIKTSAATKASVSSSAPIFAGIKKTLSKGLLGKGWRALNHPYALGAIGGWELGKVWDIKWKEGKIIRRGSDNPASPHYGKNIWGQKESELLGVIDKNKYGGRVRKFRENNNLDQHD